jgi:hypothetical protein
MFNMKLEPKVETTLLLWPKVIINVCDSGLFIIQILCWTFSIVWGKFKTFTDGSGRGG